MFTGWLRDLNRRFNDIDRRQSLHRTRSADAFSEILVRERSRAERSGRPVSLVVFELEGMTAEEATDLLRTLIGTVRLTDEIGWFDESRIGAVLPDTPPEGARVFACKVGEALSQTVRYRIYVHPASPDMVGNNGNGDSTAADDHAGELRPLLVSGIPAWKRMLDIMGSGIGLVLLSPLLLAIAILIKAVSPGPVFFRQQRVGFLGRPFQMVKFRTMKTDAEVTVHAHYLKNLLNSDTPMQKLDSSSDGRIIRFGRILRRSSLDELPQLINVWKGEMSLVGPRPCIPYEAKEYEPWQTRRFDTMPGMTGLWQVSGKNRTTFKQMVRLDINYLGKRSALRDVLILSKTFPTVMGLAFGKEAGSNLNGGYRANEINPCREVQWHDWRERPGALTGGSAS
jgi:lipopolysaccharide/colanic/teichoic acid biosynthesis glycosyltransferase